IEVVPLGVSPQFLNAVEGSRAAPASEDADRVMRLLYVGLLIPRKGVPTLIDAAALLAASGCDFRLTIAGDGPQRADLADRALRAGLADRVEFLGRVEEKDLPALYHGSDIF